MVKAHSLTGRINEALMLRAFKSVKKNRGAAGVDKVSIRLYERNLDDNLTALMKALKSGSYRPRLLLRKWIDKGNGKKRPLGIPTVRDRVAQQVLRLLIEPYFEPYFSECSFGFRPNRSCHQAIQKVIKLRKLGYIHVLDADISGFFDNIPHDLIISLVAEKISDGNILKLIRRILNSGILEDGIPKPTVMGTPQGGVISPLLANIVLDKLDKKLTDMGYVFVRYADDFLVLTKSKPELEKALDFVRVVIQEELTLCLSDRKTRATSFAGGFDFLGFHFSLSGITIRQKSVENLKNKIRAITVRKQNFSDEVIRKINSVTRGFANYFDTGFSNVRIVFSDLDGFIRRRLRCMKTKRISRDDNFKIPNKYFLKHGYIPLLS